MSTKDEALKLAQDIADAAGILRAHNHFVLADRLLRHAEALTEQPAQQQEPVAWVCEASSSDEKHAIDYWPGDVDDLPIGTKLYTSPPASKPLTDEQTDRAIAELGLNYFADAANNRAVLRELCRKAAHGIKEKNNG